MRTKRVLATVCLALCASATPIFAADLVPEEPIAPIDWTGLHLGVGVGGNFMFADVDAHAIAEHVEFEGIRVLEIIPQLPIFSLLVEAENNSDLGKAGLFGTVEGGFDFQLGSNFVLGIVGNYDFGSLKAKSHSEGRVEIFEGGFLPAVVPIGPTQSDTFSDFDVALKMEDSWGIGGRLGFLPSESTLIYGIGGYTRAEFKAKAALEGGGSVSGGGIFDIAQCIDLCGNFIDVSASDKDWLSGYFVGGGIETLFGEHVSLKLEYRYANYKSLSFEHEEHNECGIGILQIGPCSEHKFVDMKVDPTVHSVRAVLSWRF